MGDYSAKQHPKINAAPVAVEDSQRLAAEFDPRLADVWLSVFENWPSLSEIPEELSWFLRMAYLRGYEDALCEPVPGRLHHNLGVPVPGARPGRAARGRVR